MIRGIRLRLALALLLVVAGALGVVYLIVVPSLEDRLVDAKLSQLEEDAHTVAANLGSDTTTYQSWAEVSASVVNSRVVIYGVIETTPPLLTIFGDSNTSSSLDVERDQVARRAAETGRPERATVERNGRRFAEVAVPLPSLDAVVLLNDSLVDPLSSLHLVERRLLVAGLIGLAFALVVGYGAAAIHARRIRRLERAVERIAAGGFDEPVVDEGRDELGELAAAVDRMRKRLENLDRARREFIANASHELRTPLFSLGGFLELMADEDLDEATRLEFLDTMREQVARLAKLATDLLDLSRLDAGRMRIEHAPVDLGNVAQLLEEEFSVLALRSGHRIEVIAEGRPIARADELRVLQIGRALVDNALVHSPSGTRVILRARADREHAYLEIEDEGPGVAPDHAPHVFERFYRGDGDRASGSGLGLAIARELATAMDGEVTLDSRPGRTVVRVVLGAAPTSAPASAEPAFSRENA